MGRRWWRRYPARTRMEAKGADLLVTDQRCRKAWAVQVKTNASTAKWWLLSDHSRHLRSAVHVYVFVSVPKTKNVQPRFYVVPSRVVAKTGRRFERSTGSIWYGYQRQDKYENNWKLFGRSGNPL